MGSILQKSWDKRANKALHWTGISLRYAPTNGARVESNFGFTALRCLDGG